MINNKISKLLTKHREKSIDNNNKLNIFTIISDSYHKENFHSDIIKAMLCAKKNILFSFIDILNQHINKKINKENYKNPLIEREKSNIDILISDPLSKRAIIIENKINNAVDQEQQLPRYYNRVKKQGYKIDTIVYLSIDGVKFPNTQDWYDKTLKNEIKKILIKLPAYSENKNDLYSLMEKYSQHSDGYIACLAKQYADLLKILSNKHILSKKIMADFYNELLDKDKFSSVRELIKMYNNIPSHYALKTQERFNHQHAPFESIQIANEVTAYFNRLEIGESNFAIDINHKKDVIFIEIFDRNHHINETRKNPSYDLLKTIDTNLLGFQKTDDSNSCRLRKSFIFPDEEDQVYPFLEKLLMQLNEIQSLN